ncbi:MAG: lysophospholipid acyltransferase family protein [Bacteroidales bacterium]|jgi:putative hemolysin|nr:lysophospholipid acyltransferase family protein [Bacteroidales bacterium]
MNDKKLVFPKDILQVNPTLAYLGGEGLARFIMYVLRFSKLNKIYEQIGHKQGIEFIDALIEFLDVDYLLPPDDLAKIPVSGPFIMVSNHPYGGLDGILLIKIISRVRPDVKVLANFLLKRIEPISDYFLAVNPFHEHRDATSNMGGIKGAIEHLKKGGALSIFPAGEVSSYDASNRIIDKQWSYTVLKFIAKAKVPVVPVYFSGSNSWLFHLMGRIHPMLRTAKLPSELLNKKHRKIKVRIGAPISVAEQETFTETYQFGRFLRAKTYCLDSRIEVKRFFRTTPVRRLSKPEEIAPPAPTFDLVSEINALDPEYMLFSLKNYTVYCAPATAIPVTLYEIGRLREITFREVGEGTNRAHDVDEYDLYYNQLFIWDAAESRLVGAYRIGLGASIYHEYGRQGFYLQSLFRLSEGLEPWLKLSLELGRSFVVKAYQRQPLPLFMLWKGILFFLLKNPQYRYLIGPVSISNNYSKISKELIIKFIMAHHFDWNLARFVKSRKAFKFKTQDADLNVIMENLPDINKLDKFISDVDELNSGLPVLLKKYIKLNAKIIGFNVDPKFNNSLDGLIILDLYDVPMDVIESLSKEVNDGSILKRFYDSRELDTSIKK